MRGTVGVPIIDSSFPSGGDASQRNESFGGCGIGDVVTVLAPSIGLALAMERALHAGAPTERTSWRQRNRFSRRQRNLQCEF